MASKGYTTPERVQSQLGRTLTDAQIEYLTESVIPAAEEWIDTAGGRVYGSGVVVAEQLVMGSQYTWLSKTPVASIERVRGYYWGQQPGDIITLNTVYWTLVDAQSGYLRIPGYRNYQYLEVDYTPDATIPERIRLATAIVCGVFMRTVLHPETEWLTDYASGQDVRFKFRNMDMPATVYELLGDSAGSIAIA
jgi:hypothetical protein